MEEEVKMRAADYASKTATTRCAEMTRGNVSRCLENCKVRTCDFRSRMEGYMEGAKIKP